MTLQPIVPARPRPARCAELTDTHRPTRPVAARRGRPRAQPDSITAELLDLTWEFLTHAAPTVRAELGQFLTDHGQHPVAGLGGPGVIDGRTETRKVNQWSVLSVVGVGVVDPRRGDVVELLPGTGFRLGDGDDLQDLRTAEAGDLHSAHGSEARGGSTAWCSWTKERANPVGGAGTADRGFVGLAGVDVGLSSVSPVDGRNPADLLWPPAAMAVGHGDLRPKTTKHPPRAARPGAGARTARPRRRLSPLRRSLRSCSRTPERRTAGRPPPRRGDLARAGKCHRP
jgi:hypothetical protein